MAGLLFFLNPELPFAPGPIFRAILAYAGLLSLVSLAVHLPFTWSRPRRARRILPWSLTAVLAAAAVVNWTHASHFAFYLPSGINVRLIKAAVFLSIAAVIAFYTSLLHAAQRRPYELRSQVGLAVLCLASVYVMVERREAFQPRPHPEPRRSAVDPSPRPRLLVVGLDAATLDAVLPLAERGHLPFFSRLLQEGAAARLRTFTPTRRVSIWTSIATGTVPWRHGIVSPRVVPADLVAPGSLFRLRPAGLGFDRWGTLGASRRATDSTLRRQLPLWEILSRLGVPTAVIGWPVLEPVPATLRVALAEPLFEGRLGERYGAPDEVAERARVFRQRVEDLDPSLLARFGPEPPWRVLQGLAQDRWRSSLTLFLAEQRPDLRALFVVLPGLGIVSESSFGGWAAREFEGSQDDDHAEAARLVEAYYITLDSMLERLWSSIEGPRLLAVVSGHGIDGPGRWSRLWRSLTFRDARIGRRDRGPDGLLLLAGEGVSAAQRMSSPELVDLVPTLLYGLGFPIARDLGGQVITEAFSPSFLAQHPLTFVPSFETLEPYFPNQKEP